MLLKIRNWLLNLEKVRIPDVQTRGVLNRTDDGYFVLFMDYDDVCYSVVLQDIIHVKRVFGLMNFVILENSSRIEVNEWGDEEEIGSYLLFGLDKITYWQCRLIMSHMRGDYLHKKIGSVWSKRCWVNRIEGKYKMENGKLTEIRPKPVIKDAFFFKGDNAFMQSKSFIDFFDEWFDFTIPLKGESDGTVTLIDYSTLKKEV